MTQKAEWTEKHRDYAITHKLPASTWALWEWLVQEGFEGKEETVDLREFNRHIAKKRGKPFDRRTVKDAARRLIDAGILKKCQKFTEFVWHWVVCSIATLLPPKKKDNKNCKLRSAIKSSTTRSHNANLAPSNPSNADERDITTTTKIPNLTAAELGQLEESVEACKEAGICYHPKTAIQVLAGYSIEEVKAAIAYTLPRATSNVEGYLRMCLENAWWKRASRPASLVDVFALIYQQLRGQNE
jgi:hypothetical protein